MFSSRSVQIAAVFSDVFGQALPNLCRSFYNETKAEMFFSVFAVALLAEGVDRNCNFLQIRLEAAQSPSSRRAWIEIFKSFSIFRFAFVALLAEGVDRNLRHELDNWQKQVALLAEGVDRNSICARSVRVAASSPSSRRAWIEMDTFSAGKLAKLSRPPRGGRG